jgi:hypothetical protein
MSRPHLSDLNIHSYPEGVNRHTAYAPMQQTIDQWRSKMKRSSRMKDGKALAGLIRPRMWFCVAFLFAFAGQVPVNSCTFVHYQNGNGRRPNALTSRLDFSLDQRCNCKGNIGGIKESRLLRPFRCYGSLPEEERNAAVWASVPGAHLLTRSDMNAGGVIG